MKTETNTIMGKESLHTPLPWSYDDGHIFTDEPNRDYNSIAHVYDIYTNEGSQETGYNAKLIVTAVNNHYKLIEALEKTNNEYNYALKLLAEAGGFTYSENNVSLSNKQLLTQIKQSK